MGAAARISFGDGAGNSTPITSIQNHRQMRICVTMVGVCRPSFERVRANIEANVAYFTTKYPNHTFTYIALTYRNDSTAELREYCSSSAIELHVIEPLDERDFRYKVKNPNWYRLFYSMESVMNTITEGAFDCILRVRLDTEVKEFELYNTISENTYYTVKENGLNRCSDNIGYGSYSTMKRIWQLKNCRVRGFNMEEVLYHTIKLERDV